MEQSIPANLFRGIEGVGGRLHFMPDALVFNSHAFNVQTGTTTIPYACIVDVRPRSTMGLVPNGMSVFTYDGQEFRFVIWNRKEVIAYIKAMANLR